jgi:hypothetical protein
MAEPPVTVDPEGSVLAPRRAGLAWFDLAVALTAIVLSLVSLTVAIGNARTQERMVAAATWPLLQFSTSNVGPDGEPLLVLEVVNAGMGPALLKDVRINYRGRPTKNLRELLAACCFSSDQAWLEARAKDPTVTVVTSTLSESVIRPGERLRFIVFARKEAVAKIWEGLESARNDLQFDACYCSVFEECWRSDLRRTDLRPVDQCPQPSKSSYEE